MEYPDRSELNRQWLDSLRVSPARKRVLLRGICIDCGQERSIKVQGRCKRFYDIHRRRKHDADV